MPIPIPTRRSHNFQDLTGRQFGRLLVVGYAGKNADGNSRWECRCECGGISTPTTRNLTSGRAKSCGCVGRDNLDIQRTGEAGKKSSQIIQPDGRIILKHGHVCLVDSEDLPLVSPFNWTPSVTRSGIVYAKRSTPSHILMHVLLMGATGVDHKNGNGLDNRRENLRFATPTQNEANKGKQKSSRNRYKGVMAPRGRYKSWYAAITINGKRQYLGRFATEEEAARAYDQKAKELHGEFARLNFPDEPGQ